MSVRHWLGCHDFASPEVDAERFNLALGTFSLLLPCHFLWQWRRLLVHTPAWCISGWAGTGQALPDSDEVLRGLGHLQPVNAQMPRVHEVVDPLPLAAALLVVVGLCLGQLIVVVRKAQVLPARMDVHFLSNDAAGHGRALYMPACKFPVMQHVSAAETRWPQRFGDFSRQGSLTWPTSAPRRFPGRLARLGCLPEGKVFGATLLGRHKICFSVSGKRS